MSQALVPGKVKIDIIGAATEVFGCRSCEVDVKPEMTLRDLLAALARDAGPGFKEKVYDRETGKMNEHLPVFVNSREARSLHGLDTPLEPGDVVTIMPPMAGGCGNARYRGVVEKVDAADDRRLKS
jgi:molybdopterin converting factor small subunit